MCVCMCIYTVYVYKNAVQVWYGVNVFSLQIRGICAVGILFTHTHTHTHTHRSHHHTHTHRRHIITHTHTHTHTDRQTHDHMFTQNTSRVNQYTGSTLHYR